jgi:hypothetical protein
MPVHGLKSEPQRDILFSLNDYLELMDYTGRILHPGKRGQIPEHQPPILKRLGLNAEEWLAEATEFEDRYHDNRRAYLDRQRSAA